MNTGLRFLMGSWALVLSGATAGLWLENHPGKSIDTAIKEAQPCAALATARCSPAGPDAFTDSDGLRQTTDHALWTCYQILKRRAASAPDTTQAELYRTYYSCLHMYGIII